MCGIIGYTGPKEAIPVLLQGLKAMEYRGYDSSGVGFIDRRKIRVIKKEGRVTALEKLLPESAKATSGIGHTRWATHGVVNDTNAHPHVSASGRVAIVHNGIIDNYTALREELRAQGIPFASDTDSEVIAQLIDACYKGDPDAAVVDALGRLEGTWGLTILFVDHPDVVFGARRGSPLMIGVGEKETFIASDVRAFLGYTRQVIYLEDGDIARVDPGGWKTWNMHRRDAGRTPEEYPWESRDAEKGRYPHFFIKEIMEQPEAIARAFGNGGRLVPEFGTAKIGGLNMEKRDFFDVQKVVYLGMGSAYYAGLAGARQMESVARVPAVAEDASELRYGNPIVDKGTLYFAISQSGETADTIAAVKEVQEKGGRVLGIVNVVGSSLARVCDGGVYIHAGPEISVTTSKAFSGQIMATALLALLFARMRTISLSRGRELCAGIQALPEKIRGALETADQVRDIAARYARYTNFLYLGRGLQYPIAMEGALKLKEISYVHAEGYSAGAMKHGPLALIGPDTPSVFLLAEGETFEKTLANMEEVKARRGKIIAVSDTDDPRLRHVADDLVIVPSVDEILAPLLTVVPLQLFAYYLALELGRDIDHPRNLAKSVTVE